ncbi:hypothetical protein Fcan01_25294 [Folsomia candida]|uniref:Uncharacterized protein n=1 Tax=Folsomia candida TaxID=158441 RepID=A0A226D4U6_FOLCA|nr:hypothetical protein Fcan01_25294 [Folsomia candida]
MPASLIQRVIGIGIISVKTIAFLFPFELSSDHLPAQFLNYIYSTKDHPYTSLEKVFLTCLQLFMDLTLLTGPIVAATFGLLCILLACQPGLISSVMCLNQADLPFTPFCRSCILIFFGILEFVIAMQLAFGGIYYIAIILLSGVIFLWIECQTFIRRFRTGLVDQLEYRKVQIFEKILNACTRDRIFLKAAILMPSLQIFLSFAVIKMYQSSQSFSAAAKANSSSHSWINSCKVKSTSKCEKKFHRSLAPLKLMFDNNFVEVLTLVVQEFCIRQMVSFLLIMRT